MIGISTAVGVEKEILPVKYSAVAVKKVCLGESSTKLGVISSGHEKEQRSKY